MPELPEVETVMRGLEPTMLGNVISDVEIRRYDLRGGIPEHFSDVVAGQTIEAIQRRGKYIVFLLGGGQGFVLHLGMSGRVLIVDPNDPYDLQKHDHVIFTMDNGARIVFNDPRRFGMLFLIANDWGAHKAFASMGPEPLGNAFHGQALAERLAKRKINIKAALLDQNVVAGVGNIYACEALYDANIDPMRAGYTIKGDDAERLARAIKDVLAKAIKAGGSTLKDYQHADGSLGYFQHQFLVYDQEGQACPRCSCAETKHVIKRIVQSGRSTFYCAHCQI